MALVPLSWDENSRGLSPGTAYPWGTGDRLTRVEVRTAMSSNWFKFELDRSKNALNTGV